FFNILFSVMMSIALLGPCVSVAETRAEFLKFQQEALNIGEVNADAIAEFSRRSFTFWIANAVDYNRSPEKYADVMPIYHQNQEKYARDRTIKLDRFEDTINNFIKFDKRNTLANDPILFVGSSSIVFWETSQSFPEYPVINRGFGGASLPEVLHYYDDVIKKHKPSMMVVYCDIDVENGKSPEFAVNAFKELVAKVEQDFPTTQMLLLSMKPTLIDDVLGKDVRKNKIITNDMLSTYAEAHNNLHYVDITSVMIKEGEQLKDEIFLGDGMHMNPLGYELWDPVIRKEIRRILN
ncbi:MAG: hypothetical protein HOM01_06075, partial [Kordiimonadaceae bacterium]|nr:hypothetical protein [Kordiimonadaceae bacterium]